MLDTHRSSRPSSRRVSYLPRHGDNGMMITLKHRLSSLQTQCTSLRAAKQNAVKKVSELRCHNWYSKFLPLLGKAGIAIDY